MISNVDIASDSVTDILSAPSGVNYVIYCVYFCNRSESSSETVTIHLNDSSTDSFTSTTTIIKEIVIPAGETFVLGSSKKLSNPVHYMKKRGIEENKIYLNPGETLAASSSGSNVVASPIYAKIGEEEKNNPIISPTPTPSITPSPGTIINTPCSCTINPNDKYQYSDYAHMNKGTDFFLVPYSENLSPHTTPGKTIFKVNDCIWYMTSIPGVASPVPIYRHNKVGRIEGPVYYGKKSYYKIILRSEFPEKFKAGTQVYVCDSSNHGLTPTPTSSISLTPSITPTSSITPTVTPTNSVTPTVTPTPSMSITPTSSVTPTSSITPTPSTSMGASPSSTPSNTPTPSITPTNSNTPTPSVTPTGSNTPTSTPTNTPTPSVSPEPNACDPYAANNVLVIDNKVNNLKDLSGNHTILNWGDTKLGTYLGRYFNTPGDQFLFGAEDWTIEAVISGVTDSSAILNWWYSRERVGQNVFYMWFGGGSWPRLECEFSGLGKFKSNFAFDDGAKSYHMALQRKGNHLELWVEGQLDRRINIASGSSLATTGVTNARLCIDHFGSDKDGSPWGTTKSKDIVDAIRVTKGIARYDSNSIPAGAFHLKNRPIPYTECKNTESGVDCDIFEHTATKTLFTLSNKKFEHTTLASYNAWRDSEVQGDMPAGWEPADWSDFASFTKQDFINFVNIVGPCASPPMNYETAIATVGSNYEWNLGFIGKCSTGRSSYPFFLTFANGVKPIWYAKQCSYLNDFVITGAWYTTLKHIVKKKNGVTPLPSLTPTPSASEKQVVNLEYCEPLKATFFNILAFSPSALQANGVYDFKTGNISTLPNVRNFATSKNSNHSFINALFSLEMISRNKVTNQETWRLTLIHWPKLDGTLEPIRAGRDPDYYISESIKSKSDTSLTFGFKNNGAVKIDFDESITCQDKPLNLCNNVSKPDYWYMHNNHIAAISQQQKDTTVKNLQSTPNSQGTQSIGGWGEWTAPNVFRNDAYNSDPTKLIYEYTASTTSKHEITSINTYVTGNNPFQLSKDSVKRPNVVYDSIDEDLILNIFINGQWVKNVELNSIKFTSYFDMLTPLFNVSYEVNSGDTVMLELTMNSTLYKKPRNFVNGSLCTFKLNETQSSKFVQLSNVVDYWDSKNNPFKDLTVTQGNNFTKAFLPVYDLSYDQAVGKGIVHLAGLKEHITVLAGSSGYAPTGTGASAFEGAMFEDLFFLPDTLKQVGDTVYFDSIKEQFNNISGLKGYIIFKRGTLAVIRWDIDNQNSKSSNLLDQRKFDSLNVNWKFLNYDECNSNTNPGVSPSLGITPTPTPTPSVNLNTRPHPHPCNNKYSPQGVTFTANQTTVSDGGVLTVKHDDLITVRWPDGQNPNCNPNGTYNIRIKSKPTEVAQQHRTCSGSDCYSEGCSSYVCIDGTTYRQHSFYHQTGKTSYEFSCTSGDKKNEFSKATLKILESGTSGSCEANDPIKFSASMAGPWTGNRTSGGNYTCRPGGMYGNGNYNWSAAAPSGSFPKWTGPLFEMECLSGRFTPVQTWKMTVKGWNTCQGPSYTSTATKQHDEDTITFHIGAGTVTIGFATRCP